MKRSHSYSCVIFNYFRSFVHAFLIKENTSFSQLNWYELLSFQLIYYTNPCFPYIHFHSVTFWLISMFAEFLMLIFYLIKLAVCCCSCWNTELLYVIVVNENEDK